MSSKNEQSSSSARKAEIRRAIVKANADFGGPYRDLLFEDGSLGRRYTPAEKRAISEKTGAPIRSENYIRETRSEQERGSDRTQRNAFGFPDEILKNQATKRAKIEAMKNYIAEDKKAKKK